MLCDVDEMICRRGDCCKLTDRAALDATDDKILDADGIIQKGGGNS